MSLTERPTPVSFALESEAHGRGVLEAVGRRFATRAGVASDVRETLLDTFDGRLFRRGLSLSVAQAERGCLLCLSRRDGSPLRRVLVDAAPAFAADLPQGPFRPALARAIEMRRLLPRVEVRRHERGLRVLDGADKTVARVVLEHGTVTAPPASRRHPLPPRLRVVPVTGYDRAREEVLRFLKQAELPRDDRPRLDAAFHAAGVDPAAYSSKIRVKLDGQMRGGDAVREVLRSLLQTMRANEDGTRRDLDSEFLHDFRVAVRRTRACLAQMRKVFPAESLRRYRREFAWLGRVTGPTRDLDVHLLAVADHAARLPPPIAADLQPLTDYLARAQQEAQKKLARALSSRRYRELLRGWEAFVDKPPRGETEPDDAARPILELASARIRRGYSRMVDKGARLDGTSDARLHRLRIDGKKLRYLLEFFRSLYPKDELQVPLATLKRLQDNLGSINDFRVQQETLREAAARMLERQAGAAGTLLAMGRLSERLARRRERELRRFAELFAAFSGEGCREAVRRMVEPAKVVSG